MTKFIDSLFVSVGVKTLQFSVFLFFLIETLNRENVVLVLGRRQTQHKNQNGESDGSLFLTRPWKRRSCCAGFFFFICSKCLFVSAVRWRVCAYDVEQHAPGGGQRPEKALREERADRSQNERAAPPMSTLTLYVFTFLHPASQLIYGFVFMLLSLLHFYFYKNLN